MTISEIRYAKSLIILNNYYQLQFEKIRLT